jgi:hypothetical protein
MPNYCYEQKINFLYELGPFTSPGQRRGFQQTIEFQHFKNTGQKIWTNADSRNLCQGSKANKGGVISANFTMHSARTNMMCLD